MTGDDPEVEIIDTPPPGYSEVDWDNTSCCACYGCEGCPHRCHRTDEDRSEHIRHHDEALSVAMRGPGQHQLSDGSWVTVYRGPGDPDYPKGDGFDGERPAIRRLQIPIDLPHRHHGDGGSDV